MIQIAKLRIILFSLLVVTNLSCAALDFLPDLPAFSQRQAHIELRRCHFPNHSTELLCGKYRVYENRAAQTGRMISLNILIVPALTPTPADDPVFFLSGGPGQGAARIARAGEDALMRELRRERDLVFIDQRGTGDSNRLGCSIIDDRSSLQNYFLEVFPIETIRACRHDLEGHADLRFYTTTLALADIDEVRHALGYGKINLYGISYGTLSALEYLRRYPDRVRSVVLAGVVTPAAKLPLQFAKGAQLAMDRLVEDCAADESCHTAFPTLKEDFAAVLSAFANGPVRFALVPPGAKTAQRVAVSRGVFAERLRLMLTDHSSANLVPLLVHHAAQGDWLPFGNVAVRPIPAPPYTLALGTYLTITCSEAADFLTKVEVAEQTTGTFLSDYRVRRHQSACAEWPRSEIPGDFFTPVASSAPVLMLSGDIDPTNSAEYATAAGRVLPNSRQVLLRNTPHNYTSPCARALTTSFIARGNANDLDDTCAAGLRRPRFLTELPERYLH
jgi:pimeloyl-ACP methyl ester carboxylesterase